MVKFSTVVKGTLAALAVWGGVHFTKSWADKSHEEDLVEYATEHVEEQMGDLESMLNIEFKSTPEIKILDREDETVGAEYISDIVYLNPNCLFLPEPTFAEILAQDCKSPMGVKRALYHELAHHYSAQITGHDWIKNARLCGDFAGLKIINEGIATYFEIRSVGGEVIFPGWPKDIRRLWAFDNKLKSARDCYNIKNEYAYSGGYLLVKPIIDKFGEKGIRTLLTFSPKATDLFNLPAYGEVVMHHLEHPPTPHY